MAPPTAVTAYVCQNTACAEHDVTKLSATVYAAPVVCGVCGEETLEDASRVPAGRELEGLP